MSAHTSTSTAAAALRLALATGLIGLLIALSLASGAEAKPGASCGTFSAGGKTFSLRAGGIGCGKAEDLAKATRAKNRAPKGFKCNGANLRNKAICFDKQDTDRFYEYSKQ